jgi:hypothetical protein
MYPFRSVEELFLVVRIELSVKLSEPHSNVLPAFGRDEFHADLRARLV